MSLIQCPECKKQISDKAQSCPTCGYSAVATTVEQTSKRWKGLQIIGAMLVIIGFPVIFTGFDSPGLLTFGVVMMLVGLIVVIYARAKAWWYHA